MYIPETCDLPKLADKLDSDVNGNNLNAFYSELITNCIANTKLSPTDVDGSIHELSRDDQVKWNARNIEIVKNISNMETKGKGLDITPANTDKNKFLPLFTISSESDRQKK